MESAGGIFIDRPFSANPKCIVFSFVIMAFYWFLPDKNHRTMFMLPLLFIISYVSMAWYDWYYDCEEQMYTGTSPWSLAGTLDSIFKPQRRDEEQKKAPLLVANQEEAYLNKVYLFHLVLVAPFLLYLGTKGNNVDERLYGSALLMGIIAGMYHGFRYFVMPRQTS